MQAATKFKRFMGMGGATFGLLAATGIAPPVQAQSVPGATIERTQGQNVTASDLILGLTEGDVYVVPGLRSDVYADAIQEAIYEVRPTIVKVAVVSRLNNYPSRAALANDLRRRLNLSRDAVVLVATPRGISGSSGRLSTEQIDQAFRQGGVDVAFAQGGLTAASVAAVESLSKTVVTDQRNDTTGGATVLFVIVAAVGGLVGFNAWKRKNSLEGVKEPLEEQRQEVLANLSYVDGYLDILPPGDDREQARQLRASAFEKYDTATGLLKTAKTPDEARAAGPLLNDAVTELVECRKAIDRATGGTGVAMGLVETPRLDSDVKKAERFRKVEELNDEEERLRLQRELEALPPQERGVSFFSGRPLPSCELVPVTIVIQGQKRTVMATHEEADAIMRGETPQVRSFRDENGRYIPWYEHRGYDPYRDYYTGMGGLLAASAFVNLFTLTSLMGAGMYGHYGPWGYGGFGWGMPTPVGYDAGFGGNAEGSPFGSSLFGDATPANSGGMDFFGSDYEERGGGGFDGGGSDGGGFDGGGFDGGGFGD